jgi:hypothetical protein
VNVTIRALVGFWQQRRIVNPGDVLELDVRDAQTVVGCGKAVALDAAGYREAVKQHTE